MPKIVDIINHQSSYGLSMCVVIDVPLDIKYIRKGNKLLGEDSGFYNFYQYGAPTKCAQAFGGREFDIPLVDGEVIKANGQWWFCHYPDEPNSLINLGVGSVEELKKCHVFTSLFVDLGLIEEWLQNNEPSNNYNKYNTRHENFGKHLI